MAFYDRGGIDMIEVSSEGGNGPRAAISREGLAAIGVTLVAIAMLVFTWNTWPDAVNDSGRELYVAWRLASGAVLYRDVAYFNGPLSPYLNAAWFALFGPGIATLEAANGVLFAVIAALTWHLVRRVAGWGAAAASVLVLVTIFAFGPLTFIGSFSYLLPYSHEMTHGVLLLLLLLVALDRFLEDGGRRNVWFAGSLLGLTLLTKPEFGIAGCTAVLVGFGLAVYRPTATRRAAALVPLPIAAAVPPLLAWIALAARMPGRVALDGILGSWAHLTNRDITEMPYFRFFMGTDHPLANVAIMLGWSVAWTAALAGAVAVGRTAGRIGRFERSLAGVLLATLAALLVAAHGFITWRDAFRPLPLASLAVCIWAVVALRRTREGNPRAPRFALAAAAAAMSLALMLKMILFARVWHYGVALGMPATMIAVAAGARIVSHAGRRRGGSSLVAVSAAMGILIGVIASHIVLMADIIGTRTIPLGKGKDAFLSDDRGLIIGAALAAVEELAPEEATLAVLPEGVMLSYLARRPNSTPYIIGNPTDVAIFGEERMLAAYRATPPDFIVLLRCDMSIYGYAGFGQGYAEHLFAWIDANYEPIRLARTDDVRDDAFRALLLQHRDSGTVPTTESRP